MKNISLELKNHLFHEVQTRASCWKIKRKDGFVLGLTDHDQDIYFEDILYKARSGFKQNAIRSKLSGGNSFEIDAILQDDDLKEEDLLSGLYDHAECEYFWVNYNDLAQGRLLLKKGFFGEIRLFEGHFIVQLEGFESLLDQSIVEVFSPDCRAHLGDHRCKVNLANFQVFGQVSSLQDDPQTHTYIFRDNTRFEEDGHFNGGVLTWLTGPNKGLTAEIKSWQKKSLELTFFLPLPVKMNISDEYKLLPGCNKSFQNCRDKFQNCINFRGEPFVPGR